ncbi:PrgI family protein [Streptococcus alactolyticus]|uniref:PrgI family protein n=1 Tax=Streptococcus alactolyticus TaxID=29389 RepID=UPI003F9A13B1
MAYVPVPKDLTQVKTKVAFNLTKRQLIFFGAAAFLGIPSYLLLRKPLGSSVSAILMVTIMLPFFFMAMYEKDGLPFEKVMGNMIRQKFINPSTRPYKTENFYKTIGKRIKEEGVPNGEEDKAGGTASAPAGRRKKKPKREKK